MVLFALDMLKAGLRSGQRSEVSGRKVQGSLSYTENKDIVVITLLTVKTTFLLCVMLLILHGTT